MRRAILLVILLGCALRAPGVFDDFWLDEIWSARIAAQMTQASDVLLSPAARFDNNHPLITLFMYLTGDHPDWWIWRIPSLLAGCGTLVLVAHILSRRGRSAALIGSTLFAFSYPLISCSSEARGYALAVFFALLALDAAERFVQKPGVGPDVTFGLACVLGFFSHLTFLHAYAAIFVWSIVRLSRMDQTKMRTAAHVARLHVVPIAFFAFLYWTFARHLTIGGAPPRPVLEALRDSVGQLFASGDRPIAITIAAGVGLVLLVWTIAWLIRARIEYWILVLIAAVISPAVVLGSQILLAEPRQPIASRYFLVSYALLLLGFSVALSRVRTAIAVACIAVFVIANLVQTALFLRTGRGEYSAAVEYMALRSGGAWIGVAIDDPVRTGWVLEFYAKRLLPHPARLAMFDVSGDKPLTQRPMWFIKHSNVRGQSPGEFPPYVLEREFSFYGLSGYSWYLYRRAPGL